MLDKLRQHIATGLQNLSVRLQRAGTVKGLPRHECPVLIFFHGYSLAHTIRPLVVGRALRAGEPMVNPPLIGWIIITTILGLRAASISILYAAYSPVAQLPCRWVPGYISFHMRLGEIL